MLRRLHVPRLFVGDVPLDPVQARHARNVLRLETGTEVEVFDSESNVSRATLFLGEGEHASVKVSWVERAAGSDVRIVVASAVPKGERADWMVEKLSELGVATFIPLAAQRSVTLPAGKSKFERWARIATESAKQSRRAGVMKVETLTTLDELLATRTGGLVLSTGVGSQPIRNAIEGAGGEVLLAIGPEGGWTEGELVQFSGAGFLAVRLTAGILRTETAAITAAGVVSVATTPHSDKTGTRD